MSDQHDDGQTAQRHYRATIQRLKARVTYFEARTTDLEQMLARALAVADAYEAMLSGVLDRKKPDEPA